MTEPAPPIRTAPFRWLARVPVPLAVALGLLLLAPSLAMGWYADDFTHRLALDPPVEGVPMRPWSLFDFGERRDWEALEASGASVGGFPWWTGADWRVRFLRPVPSLLRWGLHASFGERAWLHHVAGLALHALVLVAAHRLYRTLGLSVPAARVAVLLLALTAAAAVPVGWVANHNSVLVALLASLALATALARRAPSGPRVAAALALAILAALSKEEGSVALVLVLVALARGEGRSARVGVAAATALAIGYAALLVGGGYGTRSLFYATPWSEPARFGANLLALASGGLLALAGPFPLDLPLLVPATRPLVLGLGILVGWPLAAWVARTVRGRRGAGWLGAWTVLFLAVQAGGPPSVRLLYVPAIGALGLLALFLEARAELERPRLAGRLATAAVALSATAGAALGQLAQTGSLLGGAAWLREATLRTDVGDPALGRRELLVLQTESQLQGFALAPTWAALAEDRNVVFWPLQLGGRALSWTRIDERTFDLETRGEPFLSGAFERVYRTDEAPVETGTRFRTRAFEVEALACAPEGPTRLRFRLARSLDDPAVRFLAPSGGRLVRIAPPAPGATLELGAPAREGPWMP